MLMKRKCVYPYDYMDNFEKFNEALPTKENFSIVNNVSISHMKIIKMLKLCGILNS